MRRSTVVLLLTVPVAVALGCVRPDLDFAKIRLGMSKKEIIARIGEPTRTSVVNKADIFEYEAYDRYGAIKVNQRSQFIRFVDDKVDAFGNIEDLKAAKPAVGLVSPKAVPNPREVAVSGWAAPATSTAFDLRTELEKLEKLKKDGLITEAEFAALRQKVMEKAKAQ